MLRSVLVASGVLLTTALFAQDESWLGKKIMPKGTDVTLGSSAGKSKGVAVGKLRLTDHMVLADQGGRLQVMQQGVAGWLDKSDAVLLDDAVRYFTGKVDANRRTTTPSTAVGSPE